ncbi:cytochrome c family protein [Sphingomonas sp.]|uniref:c-type cytochrome n=1 Tax=Sphingomonas sp. TaxID=28214 RepID=UPI0031D5A8A7
MKSLIVFLPVTAVLSIFALTALPSEAAGPVSSQGASVFAACRACHTVQAGGKSVMGPNLNGLFGRKAGSVAGFNYSPALKASKIVWDAKTLDQYLAAPTQRVPGTRMVIKVADPVKRAALIAYLKAETSK